MITKLQPTMIMQSVICECHRHEIWICTCLVAIVDRPRDAAWNYETLLSIICCYKSQGWHRRPTRKCCM